MRSRTLPLVLAVLLPVLGPALPAGAAVLQTWVADATTTVYRTSSPTDGDSRSIHLVAARGEYESAQVAMRGGRAFTIERVRFSDLQSDSGEVIPRSNLRARYVMYTDTGRVAANPYFPEREGNLLYPESVIGDPLSNQGSIDVAGNTTQPTFVTVRAPESAAAGTYRGVVRLETSLGARMVPLRLDVFDVTIPKASDSDFTQYHWTMTNGFTWDGLSWNGQQEAPAYDVGRHYYGIETYTDRWFELMDEFARVLTEYRTTMTWVRTDLLLQETGTELSDFTEQVPGDLDWSLFDRYVETFVGRGFTGFANQHLIHALNKMPAEEKPDASWEERLPDELPVTDAFLRNYLTALGRHLEEKGWTEENGITWYQHILDEPITPDHLNWWRYVAREIREINREEGTSFRLMDADPNGILLDDRSADYVDTWVPMTPNFHQRKDEYRARQAAGDGLWVYTCEVNTPPWLNRFWTQPTLTGRLLFWDLQRQGVQGHLHWAWNAWYVGPWNGDSFIVYPDAENGTVKSSLRYEAHRDGLEDLELLRILERRDPELARQIADLAVNPDNPRSYTLDPGYVKRLHDYLVRAASGADPGPVPTPTSPYLGQEVPGTHLVDDTDESITYVGDWRPRQARDAHGGGVHVTSTAGDGLTYTFRGAGIDVVAEKTPDAGRIRVSVDGGRARTVDLYEAVRHDHRTVIRLDGLAADTRHTIRIESIDDRAVRLDALRLHLHDGQRVPDATLADLTVTGTSPFVFESLRTEYGLSVPDEVGSVSITPVTVDTSATIEINGEAVDSGSSVTAAIDAGKSRVEIVVTAADGETTKTYHLTLVKGARNEPDANLALDHTSITATAARDDPTYAPDKMADGDLGTMFASRQGYIADHPFPHEIVLTWDRPRTLDTIVMATRTGLAQGITNVDVQTGTGDGEWTTVARNLSFRWRSDVDGELEYALDDFAEQTDVRELRLVIDHANYQTWNMYAVYELELYDLTDHGLVDITTR